MAKLCHCCEDFIGIFKADEGLPVTIRLLDPPLHEFLPHNEKDQAELAKSLGLAAEQVKNRVVASCTESNLMLDHRGDRLAITHPEILEMQQGDPRGGGCVEAGDHRAAGDHDPAGRHEGGARLPQEVHRRDGRRAFAEKKKRVEYLYGTMIEVPCAAITADEMAETAEFFSFGTNDLTQMTFGYSRDDAGVFLPEYVKKEIPCATRSRAWTSAASGSSCGWPCSSGGRPSRA